MVNNPVDSCSMFLAAFVLNEIGKFDDKNEAFLNRNDLFQDHCVLHASFSKFLIDSFFNIWNSEQSASETFFRTLNGDEKKRNQLLEYIQTDDISDIEKV